MRIILLKNNVVANIIEAPSGYVLPEGFTAGPEGGEIGQVWDGDQYIWPDERAADSTDELYAYLARLRWERECSGTVFNGILVPTDRERRAALKDAADKMRDGTLRQPIAVAFSAKDYAVVTLAELDTVIAAIAHHVQACFSDALAIASQIGNGSIINKAQVLAAWENT